MLRQPEVIGIASGKGGVGKTSLSVNIARQMAENGKKVFLFDGDMGLANAQIALGVKARENISHVILGEKNINEVIIQVSPGFSLIPGASGVQQMAALNNIEMAGIVSIFSEIKALPRAIDTLRRASVTHSDGGQSSIIHLLLAN